MYFLRRKSLSLLVGVISFLLLTAGTSYSETKALKKFSANQSKYDNLLYLSPSVLSPQNYFPVVSVTTTHAGPVLMHMGETPPLRDMPPSPPNTVTFPIPSHYITHTPMLSPSDSAVQTSLGPLVSTTLPFTFEGLHYSTTPPKYYSPVPDTNGAAGKDQYVQWVNVSYAVFDKASGNIVPGGAPRLGSDLWQILYIKYSDPCGNIDSGDPIAQYDKMANRWVMMQPVMDNTNHIYNHWCPNVKPINSTVYRHRHLKPRNQSLKMLATVWFSQKASRLESVKLSTSSVASLGVS